MINRHQNLNLVLLENFYMEKMYANFNGHIFNLTSFIQIILGSAVMADITHTFFAGLLFAILPAWLFIYKPGEKASKAYAQASRYEKLILTRDEFTDEELYELIKDYSFLNAQGCGFLIRPAKVAAENAFNSMNSTEFNTSLRLSLPSKIIYFLSGGFRH